MRLLRILFLVAAAGVPRVRSEAPSPLEEEGTFTEADTILMLAHKLEDPQMAKEALERGADINARSPTGRQTALMQSVLHGRTKMVRWSLEHGADATIPSKDGQTPSEFPRGFAARRAPARRPGASPHPRPPFAAARPQ